jgi:hypothetical protein
MAIHLGQWELAKADQRENIFFFDWGARISSQRSFSFLNQNLCIGPESVQQVVQK